MYTNQVYMFQQISREDDKVDVFTKHFKDVHKAIAHFENKCNELIKKDWDITWGSVENLSVKLQAPDSDEKDILSIETVEIMD